MLPLIKVGVLVLRQVSKPIANVIVGFTRLVVAGAGRYHQFEVNLRRRVLGLDPQHVRPLDTNQAMEVATGVMGEVILFAMAGGAVYWEWARQRDKEAAKAAEIDERFKALRATVTTLEGQLTAVQEAQTALLGQVAVPASNRAESPSATPPQPAETAVQVATEPRKPPAPSPSSSSWTAWLWRPGRAAAPEAGRNGETALS